MVFTLFKKNLNEWIPSKTDPKTRSSTTRSFLNNSIRCSTYHFNMTESMGTKVVFGRKTKKVLNLYGVTVLEVPKKTKKKPTKTQKTANRLIEGADKSLKGFGPKEMARLFTKTGEIRAVGFVECRITHKGKKIFEGSKFMNSGTWNHKTGLSQKPVKPNIPSFNCFAGDNSEPYNRTTDVEYLILNEIEGEIKKRFGDKNVPLEVKGRINILVSLKPCNSCCSALCIMKSLYPNIKISILYTDKLKDMVRATRDDLKKLK